MDDAQIILDLQEKITRLEERLRAVEREQRNIREDILSGKMKERMQKRLLEKPPEDKKKLREKIDKQIGKWKIVQVVKSSKLYSFYAKIKALGD